MAIQCFSCLLSPDREEAAIFLGINKVIARALEREDNNNNISSPTTTTYPCSVLNVFECPYKRSFLTRERLMRTRIGIYFFLLTDFAMYSSQSRQCENR
jgi:hypothetical protein